MKSKFTHEERQAILDRYISKSESPTSIIKSVEISKSTFYKWLSDYKIEQAEAKRKGLTLRNFNLLEAKVKRLEGIIEIIKRANVLPNSPSQQKEIIRGMPNGANPCVFKYKRFSMKIVKFSVPEK